MARFDLAIDAVLEHEGGFVDHKADPGGATNFGISLRFLRGVGDSDGDGWLDGDLDRDGDVDVADIRKLSRSDAKALYKAQWWDRYGYALIPFQPVAGKTFDLAVNMGAGQAHRLLQRSLVALGKAVEVDGQLGRQTRRAIAEADPDNLLEQFRRQAADFYRGLAAKRPDLAVFLKGWLRRAAA